MIPHPDPVPVGGSPTNKPFPSGEHGIGHPGPVPVATPSPSPARHGNSTHRQSLDRRRRDPRRRGHHHPNLNLANSDRKYRKHSRPDLSPLGPLPTPYRRPTYRRPTSRRLTSRRLTSRRLTSRRLTSRRPTCLLPTRLLPTYRRPTCLLPTSRCPRLTRPFRTAFLLAPRSVDGRPPPNVDSHPTPVRHHTPNLRREPSRRRGQPSPVNREPNPHAIPSTGRPITPGPQPNPVVRHHVRAPGPRRAQIDHPPGRRSRNRLNHNQRHQQQRADQQVQSHDQEQRRPGTAPQPEQSPIG